MPESAPTSISPSPSPPDAGRVVLRTLGAFVLSGAQDPDRDRALAELNARPRALAVLLRLALADGPVSRDLLTEEFWGDRDPDRARHSLADALSAIRRAFGRECISLRSPQLAFRPEVRMTVDAEEFVRAADTGRVADALALYRGDFLDGVFIDRAPRFDQWAMHRRFALRERFVRLAAAECRRQAAAGANEAAAALALQWQAVSPDDPAATRALLDALAAPGSATAVRRALDAWGEYVRRLAATDDEPDAELAAHAAALHARYAAMPPATAELPALPPRRTPSPPDQGAGGTRRSDAGDAPTAPRPEERPAGGPSGRWLAGSIGGVAAIAVLGMTMLGRSGPEVPPWIVVTEVEAAGVDSATLDAFALAARTALESDGGVFALPETRAMELAQLSAPDAQRLDVALADAVARRSGATAIVVPVLMQSGGRLRSAMRIIEPGGGAQVVQGPDVSRDSLLTSLDGLIARVRPRLPGRRRGRNDPLPDVATHSLQALTAFAAGRRAWLERRPGGALDAMRNAIAFDSGFAMAHLSLGEYLYTLNRPAEGEAALRRALALRDRLPPRERLTVEASVAHQHAEYPAAIAAYEGWLRRHPEDRVIRSRLAYSFMMAKRAPESAREWRRVLADDSLDADAWIDLAKVLGHSTATLDSAAVAMQRGLALAPSRLNDVFVVQGFGNILVLSGRSDSAAAVFRLLTTRDSSLAGRGHRWLGMLALWDGQPARAAAILHRALALQDREPLSALRTRWLLAIAHDMLGAAADGARNLDAMLALSASPEVGEPRVLWYTGALLARAGRVADARTVLQRLQQRMVAASLSHRAAERMLRAEIAGAVGQVREALAYAREGLAAGRLDPTLEGAGLAYRRAGMADSARRLLEALSAQQPSFGWEGSVLHRFSGLALAAIRTSAGDSVGARRERSVLVTRVPRREPSFDAWARRAGFLGLRETPSSAAP